MKTRLLTFLICFFTCFPFSTFADTPIEDGVYSIKNTTRDGFVGLGAWHDVTYHIYYVTGASTLTEDAYWEITYTGSGYTIRNEETGQWMIYTTEKSETYCKYMTLAEVAPADGTQLWNILENEDGSYSIQSVYAPQYYWNLRSNTNMLGTYAGSDGTNWNEHFAFYAKGDEPDPDPDPDPDPNPDPDPDPVEHFTFPQALHVFLTTGGVEAYPLDYVTNHSEVNGQLVIETNIGKTYTYPSSRVASVSTEAPTDFPTFESYKFNNKFNDQVFTDVLGEMIADTVNLTVAAIGKRLTPSFKVPDDQTLVYVDGVLQESKVTRMRFDKDVYYVVTREGNTILMPNGNGGYSMQPYGRVVRVHVDWLTDRAEVPRIDIVTSDGEAITSKDYYKDAEITIDGHGIFPSMETRAVQIKGRGNSSWGWPKKPYRLKFSEGVKPLGMTKGKSWVLLANWIGGSMMSNAIGMKAANLMGAAAANHIVPVDLYINGEYRGSYNLTEKVGFSNNSVDLEDESDAALLELDSYYDEPTGQKFRSAIYKLPINIKEPDFSEGTTRLNLATIKSDFDQFMNTLYYAQDISKYVDIEQLVRFMMVNELTLNYEFYHPKSTFCYRESFESDTSKYVFGPVWDLDWGFGYEQSRSYFVSRATDNYWIDNPNMEVVDFIRDLRYKYEPMNNVYKTLWKQFMDNDLQELLEYCQDYYDFAHNSFALNAPRWGDYTDYAKQAVQASNWLASRSQQIYDDMLSGLRPYIPEPEEPEEPAEPIEFANNKLYTITCRRGALVLNEQHTGLDVGQIRTNAPEEDKRFAIIDIQGCKFLYSPVTKGFLSYMDNGTWVDELGSVINFDTSNADGQYLYMLTTTDDEGNIIYFNNSGSSLVINDWDIPDDGNRWLIEEVDDFDPTEALELAEPSLLAVTNRFLFNGKVVDTEVCKVPYGVKTPAPSDYRTNSYVQLRALSNVPSQVYEDLTLDYEVQWTGPFAFSTSETDAQWYNMTIRTEYYVARQNVEPYIPEIVDEQTLATHDYQWAFGGDPYHVRLYNRTTGFAQTLTLEGEVAVMRSGDYAWELLSNSDGFILRKPGTSYACLNQLSGPGGKLGTWDDKGSLTDDGSTFRVMEAQEPLITITADDLAMVYGDAVPTLTYTVSGGELIGTPKLTTTVTNHSDVGKYRIAVEKGSVENKRLSFVEGTLSVTQAPLTIGVEDVTIAEGDDLPDFQLTYEGFRNNDSEATAFTKMPQATTTAMAPLQPGTYSIVVSGGEARNYKLSYVPGTLIVLPFDGIYMAEVDKLEKVLYDISGRRVQHVTRRGVYIVGGRKVVVK